MNADCNTNAPPFEIRRATVADAAALAEFGARTFYETFAADNTPEDMQQAPRLGVASGAAARRNPGCGSRHAAGGDTDWRARGFRAAARGARRRPACCARGRVELWRFYVDKPWQGQGVARDAHGGRGEAARARGAHELWLGVWERNERAQAFYRKCGFREGGHADLRRGHGSADRPRDAARSSNDVRIEHVGVWVRDIDTVAAFYARYFGARIGERYENPRKGFASRFLEFASGARLELMTRVDVQERAAREQLGLAHVAIAVGDEAAVDALAAPCARGRADRQRPAPHGRRLL